MQKKRNFYAKMSKRLAETLDTKTILFAKELVSKITRQGYESMTQKKLLFSQIHFDSSVSF